MNVVALEIFFFFHNHGVVDVITIKNGEKVFFSFSRYSECGSTEMKLLFFCHNHGVVDIVAIITFFMKLNVTKVIK